MSTDRWRSGCGCCPELTTKLRLARLPHPAVDIRAGADAAAVVREANPTLAQVGTSLVTR